MMDLSRVYLNTGHGFEDHTLDSGLVFRETNSDPCWPTSTMTAISICQS